MSPSNDSKASARSATIIVERTNIHRVMAELDYEPDHARRPEENLINCLHQQRLRFDQVNKLGQLVFRATHEDADSATLARLSPLLADGSQFIHQLPQGARTVTVEGGRLLEGERADTVEGAGRTRREMFLGVRKRLDAARPRTALESGLSGIAHLWRHDDRQWMMQRRSQWDAIEGNLARLNYSDRHRDHFASYFLSGVDSTASELTPLDRYLGAPLSDANEASYVFTLFDENRNEQSLLLRGALWSIAHLYDGLPEAQALTKMFVDGVLGGIWRELYALRNGRETKVSEPPDEWLERWCSDAMGFIAGPTHSYWAEYGYFADTVHYAFSIVDHLCHKETALPGAFAQLEAMVERVEHVTPQSESQRDLIEKLQQEFSRTNLPEAVKRVSDAMPSRRLTTNLGIEDQLTALAECDIRLAHPYEERDLLEGFERLDLELRPFAGILVALGHTARRAPNTPLCNSLWMTGGSQRTPGLYLNTLERLELMTQRCLSLSNWSERSIDDGKQLSFRYKAEECLLDLTGHDTRGNINKIIARYDALLGQAQSETRLYLNRYQYGHWLLFAALTPAQFVRLRSLSEIEFVALATL